MANAATRPRAAVAPRFYFWMALTCLLIALVGFMPTYFAPLAEGRYAMPAFTHIHAALFFAWTLFFCTQAWLMASGAGGAHREWGVLGAALASAMVFSVLVAVALRINLADAISPQAGAHVRAFAWVQVSGMAFFAGAVALAIMNVRRPETHKRLMLLAAISLLDAPIARWFAVFLAPPDAPPGPPPVAAIMPASLLTFALVIIAALYDWRTRGRPHPAYLIGGGAMLLIVLTRAPISATPQWQAIASWIAAFGH